MSSVAPLVALLTFVYGAAFCGMLAGLLLRAGFRWRGRQTSAAEAAWCVRLPILVVALSSASCFVPTHAALPIGGLHALWHAWERSLHQGASTHTALHGANFLLLVLAGLSLGRAAHRARWGWTVAAALRSAARPTGLEVDGAPLYRLRSSLPAAFTLGAFRPAVYLSEALLERLGARDREALLAHEAAHVRRRDGLTRLLLESWSDLMPLPGSRVLLAEWERAAERACDAAAAERLGSPCDVAAALVRVAGQSGFTRAPVPGAASFAGPEDVPGRVRALLSPPPRGASRLALAFLFLAAAALSLLATAWLRHAAQLFAHH